MRNELIRLLQEQFPESYIDANNELAIGSFAEWDSLAHFNYLLRVEEQFDIRFSIEEMAELKSIEQIAKNLSEKVK
jgi:acyl carrier protein